MLGAVITVLRAGRLFDGRTWHAGAAQVAVEGGRIVEVGPQAPVGADVEVLDLGAATLLPGLVDAHVHLTWDASPDAVTHVTEASPEELLTQAERAASAALAVGVTTVRDLGDRGYTALALRDRYRLRPGTGPELLAAGPPLTLRDGHCHFLGGGAETPDELRAAVREHLERGVDVVKVMATGGEVTPGCRPSYASQYDVEHLRAVAEVAHAQGVPVTAHAHGARGALDAVRAGFDGLEHGGFWTADSAQISPADVDALLRAGTHVVLTPAGRGLLDPSRLPPALAARLAAIEGVIGAMRAAGVRLAFASDAGIVPGKEHDVLPHSLPRALHLGFTVVQALQAMTSAAAEACGAGARKGRVARGFDADLLAVDGDVHADPHALGRTHTVVRAGTVVRTSAPVPAQRDGSGPVTT